MFQTSKDELFNKIINEYPEKIPSIIITKTNYDLLKFVELKRKCPYIHICIIGKDKIHVSEHILGFTWFNDCFDFAKNFNNNGIYIVTSISENTNTIEWLKIDKKNTHLKISNKILNIFDEYCS